VEDKLIYLFFPQARLRRNWVSKEQSKALKDSQLLWFKDSQQLSTTQPLPHSLHPLVGLGRKSKSKREKTRELRTV